MSNSPVHLFMVARSNLTEGCALQSIEHIRYYAGWADKIHGMVIPTGAPVQAITYREPLGGRMLQY